MFKNFTLMISLATSLGLVACDGSDDETSSGSSLHVPSPDWRDQIIYFVMIDRFNDADRDNNDQAGYYQPSNPSRYSGGDLKGITQQINYIKDLGATALWITPPVANQWYDPINDFTGYHGYWARHHRLVDEHYGTLADYQELSSTLHENDMYLIQDVVPNHVGNYFTYTGDWNSSNTAQNFSIIADNVPVMAPIQSPFDQNDRNNPEHFAANIYHWTPPITNFNDVTQEYTFQLADLDDVNTDNPVVVEALKDSFGYWISEVGVDGFRVDTVKFIDHPFWHEFFYGERGIVETARATGREDFLFFGEVFETGEPFGNTAETKIASFEGTAERPELKSLINFPLYAEIGRVFGAGAPPSQMRYRLEQMMTAYRDPFIVPNFIDNHDTGRFLSASTPAGLRQALATLFTIPGIPVIWQGTEQALLQSRRSMFGGGNSGATGVNSGDMFNTGSPMYLFLQSLANIRKADRIWTRGDLTVLGANSIRAGALVWRRQLDRENAFVVMNTSDRRSLVNIPETGIAVGGRVLDLLLGVTRTDDVVLNDDGGMVLELEPREVLILKETDQTSMATAAAKPTITVTNDIGGQTLNDAPTLTGSVAPVDSRLQLIIDGDLNNASDITPDAGGAWSITFPDSIFSVGGTMEHSYEIYHAPSLSATPPVNFTTSGVSFTGMGRDIEDPLDDDNGPSGSYTYPMDESFSRQQDIRQLNSEIVGSALRLIFTMREISTVWSPINGFDHVSFHIFFDLPNDDGVRVMPEQQSNTPEGFQWDLAQRTFGWGNQIYGTTGADATTRGATIAGSPVISVDETAKTVSFTYNGPELGVVSWEGVKVYATTWDIDGIEDVLRPLSPQGAQWEFGGGPMTDPKVMDSMGPVTISGTSTGG